MDVVHTGGPAPRRRRGSRGRRGGHPYAAGLVLLLAVGAGSLWPAPAAASPESRALVRQGLADLEARRYEEALRKFEAAERADPADARTVFFFQGAALNRLGRFRDALARLERAAAMRSPHPDLAFETGWALLRLGRWREAIAQLEGYEQHRPGRGQSSEFLGRAYLALGDLARAEALLEEALRRDPRLAPTVRLALADLETRRGRPEAARAQAERLLREAPDSPIARRLRDLRLPVTPPPPPKPWQVGLSLSAGYNDNVIALGSDTPLPSDISQQGSEFVRLGLAAAYTWVPAAGQSLTAAYALQADLYPEVSPANLLDQLWSLDYRRALGAQLAAALRVSDQFTLLDGEAFRNQVALRPALGYRLAPWSLAELHYTLSVSDYFVAVPDVQDRDGVAHQVGLTWFALIPGTRLQVRAGAAYTRSEADGADFDAHSVALFVGLSHPLPWAITADLSYTHTFDRYDQPNSLAGPDGFAFKRRDDGNFLSLQLSRPLLPWLRAFVRYDYAYNASTIPFYEYHQHIGSGGLAADF
jgi:tetratricopeptide (TPR) repeat protein